MQESESNMELEKDKKEIGEEKTKMLLGTAKKGLENKTKKCSKLRKKDLGQTVDLKRSVVLIP